MFVWLVALWLYAFPLTPCPSSPARPRLDFAPLLPHCTVRAPWPKVPWMEEDCFIIALFHGMQTLQWACGFRNS
jgi:hypothetical protein